MSLTSQLKLHDPLKPEHVLIADADDDVLATLSAHIRQVFAETNISTVSRLDALTNQLQQQPADFIITELDFPDSEGLQTLASLKEVSESIPILVHAAKDDPELAVQAVQSGAQDYLLKGKATPRTLKRIIQHSLERKRLVMESQRNEQMMDHFITHAPAGIAVFDTYFTLLKASNRWCDDHHLKGADAVGLCYPDAFPSQGTKWRQVLRRALKGEHVRCEEDRLRLPSGEEQIIRWEVMPWSDVEGKTCGIIQFVEVITSEYRIREELMEAKSNLEHKVAERTEELASTLAVLEYTSKAKEDFFANMTHELRTPLHAIINFSQFGMKRIDKAPKEKLLSYFSDIHQSGKRLLGLVNDILDLTKNHSGKTELEIVSSSVATLIDGVAKEMSAIIEAKKMTLEVDVDASCNHAMFDPRRLHQVIVNLTSNAIKFSPEGSTITLSAQPAPEQMVRFAVADQGIGIPEDELGTIFDEFAQSSKVKSGTFSAGTGLGLSICRQIVTAHGGSIWAETNPGGGALLCFMIPQGKPPMAAKE